MDMQLVEETRKALFDKAEANNADAVCAHYAIGYDAKTLRKGSPRVKVTTNTACHAQLTCMGGYDGKGDYSVGAECIVQYIRRGEYSGTNRIEAKHAIQFMDWLFNRSPYSEAFETKNAKEAYEQMYCVLNTEKSGDYVAASLVSLRRVWEYNYICRAFCELVDRCVAENDAFTIAHTVNWVSDKSVGVRIPRNGHISLNVSTTETLVNFRVGKGDWDNTSYKKEGKYFTYENRYGLGGKCTATTIKNCIKLIPKDGVVVANDAYVNPFQAAFDKAFKKAPEGKVNEELKPYKQFFDELAQAYPLILKELNCA